MRNVFRIFFVLALALTLLALLTPGPSVLAFKVWLASWLPFAAALDKADVGQHADKLVHLGLFALLGALAARAWVAPRHIKWIVGGLLWLALQTEWLQSYVPGRSADVADVLADALGMALGVLAFRPPPTA